MKNRVLIISLILIAGALFGLPAYALDYPHTGTNSISCDDCHYVWGSEPSLLIEGLTYGQNIDDTQYNALCWSCHDNITATQVKTHSSLQIDNGYGDWTIECRTCHEPHGNYQFRTYGSASYIYQGTVSAVDATTLTETGAGWTSDQFKDLILIPNIAWDYNNYKITGNTSDTITVSGPIDLTTVNPTDTFAIVYGKLIKSTLVTPNSGNKSVRFFNSTGAHSFADGDGTYDGVCEVCHTQTAHHLNAAAGDHAHNVGLDCTSCHAHTKGFGVACDSCHGNPPTVDAATGGPNGLVNNAGVTGSATAGAHDLHANTKGYACTTCHYNSAGSGATHNNGLTITMGFSEFSGAYQGGSYDGQAGVSYNATTTTPATSVTNTGNKACSNIYCHGNYNGSGLNASPTWDNPASVVCGSCHAASNSADSQPASGSHERHADSDNTVGGSGRGSYNREYACTLCHKDIVGGTGPSSYTIADETKHVSGTVDWKFDSTDARLAIGSPSYSIATGTSGPTDGTTPRAYGTCSTVYCHSNVQPNGGVGAPDVYNTPQWGGSASCSTNSCHAPFDLTYMHGTTITSGSHAQHIAYDFTTTSDTTKCTICHKWNAAAAFDDCNQCHSTTERTYHVNGTVNIIFDAKFGSGATYNDNTGTPGQPGNGYFSCSTVYCHSTGQSTTNGSSATPTYSTPTWGTPASGACGTCHKVSEASGLTSGSHAEHLGTTGVNGCGDCHTGAANDGSSYNDKTNHVNKLIDVANSYTAGGAPGNGYGYCSTAACHEDGTGTPVNSPTWGTTPAACTACHAAAPSSGSHSAHLAESGVACNDCHDSAVQGSTAPAQHLDGNVDVYDSSPGDLGYPQDKAKGSAYSTCSTAACHSNGLGTYKVTPTWGTPTSGCNFCHNALPTSGSHSKHVLTAASAYGSTAVSSTAGNYDFGCGNCHPVNATNHRNGSLDITLNKTHGGTLKSKNNVSDDVSGYVQTAGTSVTCSAAYCHSDTKGSFATTPNWYSGSFGGDVCANCHGNSPNSGSHSAHVVGIHYDDIYTGTSGLISASGGVGAGAGHGDPNTATTINCNICHNNTLTVSRNDNNTVCNACHNGEGNAIVSANLVKTYHVNGTADVAFATVTVRSKAQVRDDITTVTELNTYWQRNNSYKAGVSSNDSSKATLGSTASYSAGTCSTVACHNGNLVTWGSAISCDACHTGLP